MHGNWRNILWKSSCTKIKMLLQKWFLLIFQTKVREIVMGSENSSKPSIKKRSISFKYLHFFPLPCWRPENTSNATSGNQRILNSLYLGISIKEWANITVNKRLDTNRNKLDFSFDMAKYTNLNLHIDQTSQKQLRNM